MPIYPEFPHEEYQQRYLKTQTWMAEQGIDALLITGELNYVYFTGHRSPQNSVDNIRPYIFILDKQGEGTVITMPFEVDHVLECTWVSDVQRAGLMSRVDEIVSVLKRRGLIRGRIGAELGREQIMGLTYNEFAALTTALPDVEFVDAAPLLLKLRATKSPRELALMRQAAQLTATAIEETFDLIRAGMTEIEVMHIFRKTLAHHGAERVNYIAICSGRTAFGGLNCLPTHRKLQPGDAVVLDGAVEVRGYNSDVARTAIVGEPSPEVTEFYAWMMDIRRIAVGQLRAGCTPQDVVKATRQAIGKRGLETIGSGRIGHGVGLAATEYPSLAMEEPLVFEPGMVFTCNPNFIRECGFLNAEDEWVITDSEPELLSSPIAPDTLPIIRID